MDETIVTVDQVVAEARTYLGVRWHHQGRTRVGIDCAGVLVNVAHTLKLSSFDTTDYGRYPTGELTQYLREHCIEQPPGTEPAPGLVAEMAFEADPHHVALVVPYFAGGLALLHAVSQFPRKVVEHRLDDLWRRRIVRLYRLPGVTYP